MGSENSYNHFYGSIGPSNITQAQWQQSKGEEGGQGKRSKVQ